MFLSKVEIMPGVTALLLNARGSLLLCLPPLSESAPG